MENIYSRRRFIIKPFGNKSKNPKKEKLKKKVIKFIIIISISIYGFKTCLDYIQPVYETLCNEKSKSVATIITNRQTTIYMNKYQYDELFSIEKDNNGNITLIKANVTPINNMISDLTESIQHEFDNVGTQTIEITTFKEITIPTINNITEEVVDETEDYSVIIYVVKPNDTLWKIAKKYGSTIDDIVRVNGIERPEKISTTLYCCLLTRYTDCLLLQLDGKLNLFVILPIMFIQIV